MCTNYSESVNILLDTKCTFSKDINSVFNQICSNKSNCNIPFDFSKITSSCLLKLSYSSISTFISYTCYNDFLSPNYNIKRASFAYIIALIDILSMIILMIMIIRYKSYN